MTRPPIFLLLACPALLLCAMNLNAAQSAPKIACDRPEYDFGMVESTSVVTHVFQIRNDGGFLLNVPVVKGSCGCITASVSRASLAPGETAGVTAVFRPGGRSGPQIKQVLVYSSDPKTSEFRLTLRGETKQDVTFSAEAFMPGRIRPDQSVEMKLDFTNGGAAPMRVTRTETASPNLVTSFDEIEAGKKYVIRVKTVPPLPNGTMQGSIRIHTDSTNQPLLELPFYAIVTGPLVVAPPQIDLVPSTEPISRFVFINTGVVTNFSVLKVETPDPAITSEQVKSGGGGVRIMFNNLVAKKELDGTAIKITTDAEGMNEILIPIHIVPRGGK